MPDNKRLRLLRYAIQLFFLFLTLVIGYEFHAFISHFEDPTRSFVPRPPAVDAFMPIAGLMAVKYFLFTGTVEPIHPAAFVMFVAIVGVSLAMKKGFCGWICPIGTLSQYLWMAGEKVFRKNFRIEKYTDISLRSIKYLLMGMFLLLIGVAMAPNMMVLFFISDYYKLVDVRTMEFFTKMSTATFWVLIGLAVLSLLYKNVWCRYLCPYGALLGLASKISPVKIARAEEKCVHCSACTKNCPSLIDVEKENVIGSAECFGCLTCVSHCPSNALAVLVKAGGERKTFHPYLFPAILIVLFYAVIGIGMATDNWHSKLPYEEYQRIIKTDVKAIQNPEK